MRLIIATVLLTISMVSYGDVKMTTSKICHPEYSPYYTRIKNYVLFDTLEHCLATGRLPKGLEVQTNDNTGNIPEYDRGQFGSWLDEDRDCLNTRHELLEMQSLVDVVHSDNECRILQGEWYDPYTGMSISDASYLDIDHVVPLKFAWYAGAYRWTRDKRIDFANDELNLLIVSAAANRSKGAKSIDEWKPANTGFHDSYLEIWGEVCEKYKLSCFP